jgi:hypothetical protein
MDLNDPTTVALLAAEAFEAVGLPHALYGGLLLASYGDARETRDADVAVLHAGAQEARAALERRGLSCLVSFEDVVFGGLTVSRVAVVGGDAAVGLNTVDLVRPRSARLAAALIDRAETVKLRDRPIRVVTIEDFIVLKTLSTRERDIDDAASVLRRSGAVTALEVVDREPGLLAYTGGTHCARRCPRRRNTSTEG